MGFSSLTVIFGIISSIYEIDYRIQNLYSRKRELSNWTRQVGSMGAMAFRLKPGDSSSVAPIRHLIITPGEMPRYSDEVFTNGAGPDAGSAVGGGPYGIAIKDNLGNIMSAGDVAPADANDPNQGYLGPGEFYATAEETQFLYQQYLRDIKFLEEDIDQELEQIKAVRQSLVSQREEFTKYIGEGIKTTFKNNYA